MDHYYVHKGTDSDGDHEVHKQDCDEMRKNPQNFRYVGLYGHCRFAVADAGKHYAYTNVNGCKFCCPACNTG